MEDAQRRAILLPGMHRSGTSATSRVMNLLGCAIPGPVVPPFRGNDVGHWEPQEIVDLHEAMLSDARVNVNSVFGVDPAWFESDGAERHVTATVDVLQRHFREAPLHVIKDPRMAQFIPIWRRALERLGIEPVFVFPFRDPAEVAASLLRRQIHFYPDTVWPLGRGVLLWLRYVLEAERASRGARRAFLAYDALLSDWRVETDRLAEQLGLDWPCTDPSASAAVDAFLNRELKHEVVGRREAFPLAYRVFDQLRACVQDPERGDGVFNDAYNQLEQASGLFKEYVCELELRLGAHPTLRTEFVDFIRASGSQSVPDMDGDTTDEIAEPGATADVERFRELLVAARGETRVYAARLAELEFFNAALVEASRISTHASSSELKGATAARDDAEHRAASASAAQAEAEEAGAAAELRASEHADALAAARLAVEAERDRSRSERDGLVAERLRIESQLRDRSAELDQARARADELNALLLQAREQADTIRSSFAWRLTAPFRSMLPAAARPVGPSWKNEDGAT